MNLDWIYARENIASWWLAKICKCIAVKLNRKILKDIEDRCYDKLQPTHNNIYWRVSNVKNYNIAKSCLLSRKSEKGGFKKIFFD